MGAALGQTVSLSLQVIGQSSRVFGGNEVWLGDLFFRIRLADWLEATLGAGIWSDLLTSPLGNKQTFYKMTWGMAVPF